MRTGFAEQRDNAFRLTPRVLRLEFAYLSSVPVADVAQPRMRSLAAEVNESRSLSALDDGQIVYLARVPAARSMPLVLDVGARLPAYPTSMGRVLLAALSPAELDAYLSAHLLEPLTRHTVTDVAALRTALDRVRRSGLAVIDQEREEGVRSAAAPVRDSSGQVVAALNLSVNTGRITMKQLREQLVPQLTSTARDISTDLGWPG